MHSHLEFDPQLSRIDIAHNDVIVRLDCLLDQTLQREKTGYGLMMILDELIDTRDID
jgi:hypothetical protein